MYIELQMSNWLINDDDDDDDDDDDGDDHAEMCVLVQRRYRGATKGPVLLVHVMAEVNCFAMRFKNT